MVIESIIGEQRLIILRPNHSANWKQTKRLFLAIALASGLVTLYWISIGAWMVLPFIGLELIAFFFLSRIVCAKSFSQEVLTLDANQISVTFGKQLPERRWDFLRTNTELIIVKPHHSLSPHQLKLKDPDKTLEIGSRLNKEDNNQLIHCLKDAKLTYRYAGQTKTTALDSFESQLK